MTSAPITELTTVSAPKAILAEWLALWFDGSTHTVGQHADIAFPLVPADSIRFDIDPGVRPVTGSDSAVEIRVVIVALSAKTPWTPAEIAGAGEVRRAFQMVMIQFYVVSMDTNSGDANKTVDLVTERLFAILNNPSGTLALSEKGITRCRATPPRILMQSRGAARMVTANATLQWAISHPA